MTTILNNLILTRLRIKQIFWKIHYPTKKYPPFRWNDRTLLCIPGHSSLSWSSFGIINTSPQRGVGFLYETEEKTTEVRAEGSLVHSWTSSDPPQNTVGKDQLPHAGFKLHYTWSLSGHNVGHSSLFSSHVLASVLFRYFRRFIRMNTAR